MGKMMKHEILGHPKGSDEPKWINTGQKNPQKHGGLNNQGLDLPSGNLT